MERTYVEPCCCDRQLPELLRDNKLFFQTNGDVTEDKILASAASLVGNGAILVYTNLNIDDRFLKVIKHYFERGWIAGAILMADSSTQFPNILKQKILSILGDYIDNIHFSADPLIINSQLCMIGEKSCVLIRGDLSMSVCYGMTMFAGILGKVDDSDLMYAALAPIVSKVRLKHVFVSKNNEKIDKILNGEYFK